mmetsp:Transcript_6588/g.10381  ORF Transcript_6588/g.10381 Transcript_6588/m.10381 type:complete len:325 (+) Transcript_6588:845-1819(+)
MARWDFRSLASRIKANKTFVCKQSLSNRWFMYTENTFVNRKLLRSSEDETIELPGNEMLDKITNGEEYVYFTSPMREFIQDGDSNDTRAVWVSSKGCGTRAHYDAFDNRFRQLEGEKRVRVWKPQEHINLHIYPDAHPRARKSQVNSDAPCLEKHPFYKDLGLPAEDRILGPGDVIEIPAFWFHEIESMTASVSCNEFTESAVARVAAGLFQTSQRYVDTMDREFVRQVVEEMLHGDDPTEFIGRILSSRYTPLGLYNPSTTILETETHNKANIDLLVPWFNMLWEAADHDKGTVEIVCAHLLELWMVNRYGAKNVAQSLHDCL